MACTSVICIVNSCYNMAIFRRIRAIIINTIDLKFWCPAVIDCPSFKSRIIRSPLLTNVDSSFTISLVANVVRVLASLYD